MKVIYELDLYNFYSWCGARDTLNRIIEEDKCEEFEEIIEELYPDGISETNLNDMLWFDSDTVFEWLGISNEEDEE